jgi:hypothetical protein
MITTPQGPPAIATPPLKTGPGQMTDDLVFHGLYFRAIKYLATLRTRIYHAAESLHPRDSANHFTDQYYTPRPMQREPYCGREKVEQ